MIFPTKSKAMGFSRRKIKSTHSRSLMEYAEVRNVSDTSFEEGLQLGIEKGEQNAKLAIAKALKDKQIPIDIIIATTGLTEQEIKTL